MPSAHIHSHTFALKPEADLWGIPVCSHRFAELRTYKGEHTVQIHSVACTQWYLPWAGYQGLSWDLLETGLW